MSKEYKYTELRQTARAVSIMQEFEDFLRQRNATLLDGNMEFQVSEIGDVTANVRFFLPCALLEEYSPQQQMQEGDTLS